MWFIIDDRFLVFVGVVGIGLFVWQVILGFRGRRVGDVCYCGGCGYCLTGLDGPRACVECGFDFGNGKGVLVGEKRFLKGHFLRGLMGLVLCFGFSFGVGMVEAKDRPLGWLLWEMGRLDDDVDYASCLVNDGGALFSEVGRRIDEREMGVGESGVLFEFLLRWIEDGVSKQYSEVRSFGPTDSTGLIDRLWREKYLNDEQILRLFKASFKVELSGRDVVAVDGACWVGFQGKIYSSMGVVYRLDRICVGVEVDGVRVGDFRMKKVLGSIEGG